MPLIAEYALSAAVEIAQHAPAEVPAMYEAICEPFASRSLKTSDWRAAHVGQRLGPHELADAMEMMEPYPNWTGPMLKARVEVYEQTRSKHLARRGRACRISAVRSRIVDPQGEVIGTARGQSPLLDRKSVVEGAHGTGWGDRHNATSLGKSRFVTS